MQKALLPDNCAALLLCLFSTSAALEKKSGFSRELQGGKRKDSNIYGSLERRCPGLAGPMQGG